MRHYWISVAVLVVAVVVASSVAAADHGRVVRQAKHSLRSRPRDPPTKKFTVQTKGPIYSDPSVASGVVFAGSSDDHLYAVNAWDGSTNFTIATNASVYGSPTPNVASHTVYVGDNAGNLYAADYGKGGMVRWIYNTSYPITSAPLVYFDLIIFGCYDANIYAIEQTSGKLVWNYTTGSFVSATPALTTTMWGVDAVVVGSQDGFLYALEAITGNLLWKWFDGTGGSADPISDGCVITNAGAALCSAKKGRFFAINVSTGDKLWERQRFVGTPSERPALSVDQQSVYFPADFNKMYCVDVNTGDTKWSYTHASSYLQTAAGIVGNEVVFGTGDSTTTVIGLDSSTGAKLWEYTDTSGLGSVSTLITASGSDIFFGTSGGGIFGVHI